MTDFSVNEVDVRMYLTVYLLRDDLMVYMDMTDEQRKIADRLKATALLSQNGKNTWIVVTAD